MYNFLVLEFAISKNSLRFESGMLIKTSLFLKFEIIVDFWL